MAVFGNGCLFGRGLFSLLGLVLSPTTSPCFSTHFPFCRLPLPHYPPPSSRPPSTTSLNRVGITEMVSALSFDMADEQLDLAGSGEEQVSQNSGCPCEQEIAGRRIPRNFHLAELDRHQIVLTVPTQIHSLSLLQKRRLRLLLTGIAMARSLRLPH